MVATRHNPTVKRVGNQGLKIRRYCGRIEYAWRQILWLIAFVLTSRIKRSPMQALTFLSDGVIATRDTAVALPRQVWRETAFRTLSHGRWSIVQQQQQQQHQR